MIFKAFGAWSAENVADVPRGALAFFNLGFMVAVQLAPDGCSWHKSQGKTMPSSLESRGSFMRHRGLRLAR